MSSYQGTIWSRWAWMDYYIYSTYLIIQAKPHQHITWIHAAYHALNMTMHLALYSHRMHLDASTTIDGTRQHHLAYLPAIASSQMMRPYHNLRHLCPLYLEEEDYLLHSAICSAWNLQPALIIYPLLLPPLLYYINQQQTAISPDPLDLPAHYSKNHHASSTNQFAFAVIHPTTTMDTPVKWRQINTSNSTSTA